MKTDTIIFLSLFVLDIILFIIIFSKFCGDERRKKLYDKIYREYIEKSQYELYREYNIIKNDMNSKPFLKYFASAFGGVILSRIASNSFFVQINNEFIGASDSTVIAYILLLCVLIVEVLAIIIYENGLRMEILRMIMLQQKLLADK